MAVTLEDVALLFGLPCSGEPIGLLSPPPPELWRDVLLARFAGVVRRPSMPEVRYSYHFFIVSVCSLSLNFEFFQASFMRDDANEQTSNKHLEAYMLWLFG
jgi:hypothetical protein